MTRLDIVKTFIKLSGRYDLVQDRTSYVSSSPLGVDYFIKAGSRWLDRNSDRRVKGRWYKKDISSGDITLRMKDVRSFKEVWAANSSTRYMLAKKPLEWMRDQYPEPLSSLSRGEPLYWSPVPISLAPSLSHLTGGENILLSPSFDSAYGWEMTGDWTIDTANGQAVNVGLAGDLYQDIPHLVPGESYTLTVKIGSVPSNPLTPYLGGTAGTAFSLDTTQTIVAGSSDTLLKIYAPTSAGVTLESVSLTIQGDRYTDIFSYDASEIMFREHGDSEEYAGILFYPPADGVYTISVLANFYEKALVNDTDKNFWSINYPNLLVRAALLELEKTYRNTEGVSDYERPLREDLLSIDFDGYEEEVAGINKMLG